MAEDPNILFEQQGRIGMVTLDRPKALNALTLGMIEALHAKLEEWREDSVVQAVVIRGTGPKAFCAGGDVRAVYDAGREGSDLTQRFFHQEYSLNRTIKHYPKPFVALLDGITMGGGMGVSIHGRYRIATEKTLMAMPETAIGFFPDVGGSYFLSRLQEPVGLYLALTGARLDAADALHTELATHYIPSDRLEEVVHQLSALDIVEDEPWTWDAQVAEVLVRHSDVPGDSTLAGDHREIERHFGQESVGAVMDSLREDNSDWANEHFDTLQKRSPTSLIISFEELRRAANLDFDSCMRMEYRMSQACMAGHDFYEGIRAVLVDKDHAPKWVPADLTEVTQEMVQAHFRPLGEDELAFD
ncbi:enoyl-CoA hydratase/isomerase family protein [Fodinicurvata sediminis]|uniref:enoyl-CoA hydratase/isomerase family protein n=1 Tax=Fodinicurvata sediminis TaxID=1121832 RepID=UPI0003B49E16|nr:enoyl-CoA hydratase/isomerase family protein [Fodinicurvata sediminis]